MKILFVLKKQESYGSCDSGDTLSTGLYNSVQFVVAALNMMPGISAMLVVVCDNNDIDREVAKYKPDVVIIEALWVVPEKFDVLKPLHPAVQWVVRLHSAMPFIANEGIAMQWIQGYLSRDVHVSANDSRMYATLKRQNSKMALYQPNVYIGGSSGVGRRGPTFCYDIGCFGAIRPMKNQLTQAVAAIRFADETNRTLRFHINSSRVEMKGSPVLSNIRALFNSGKHSLVEHAWLDHAGFLSLCGGMALGMQVSMSETFNVVAADLISSGVPVVGSPEITWLPRAMQADPNSEDSIVKALHLADKHPQRYIRRSQRSLLKLSARNTDAWAASLKQLGH